MPSAPLPIITMTAREKRDRWKQLQRDLPALATEVLVETKASYIDLNVDQLKRGETSTGAKIGRYKNPNGYYAKRKFRQNPLAGQGNVDLINLGDWSEQLDIDVEGRRFKELSRDDKDAMLTRNYGPDIYGLQANNLKAYRRDEYMPLLRKKAARITNG